MMENNTTMVYCTLPHEISLEQQICYSEYSWWMDCFASLLIGFIGILLNATAVGVLLFTSLAESFFNYLLAFLALFDSLFLLNGILESFRNHVGKPSYLHNCIFVNFLYPLPGAPLANLASFHMVDLL